MLRRASSKVGAGCSLIITRFVRINSCSSLYTASILGNRVVDLYARWRIDCLNLQPDIISILIGVNDSCQHFTSNNGVETKRFYHIYRDLLSWTKEELPSCRLLLGEPFVLFEKASAREKWVAAVGEKRDTVRHLATEMELPLVPYQQVFDRACQKAEAAYWLYDGIHPTAAGHQLMAEAWYQTLLQTGWF